MIFSKKKIYIFNKSEKYFIHVFDEAEISLQIEVFYKKIFVNILYEVFVSVVMIRLRVQFVIFSPTKTANV